jgi:hypothetical protein
LNTRYGQYCWQHRLKIEGLRIKPSTVPNGGLGLYAGREFSRGEQVTIYCGDIIEGNTQAQEEYKDSKYLLQLKENKSIDAARTNTADGRLVNDARGTVYTNNVLFCISRGGNNVAIRANRMIKKGEEIFAAYGRGYWNKIQRLEKQANPLVPNIPIKNSPIINHEPDNARGQKSLGTTKNTPIVIDTVKLSYSQAILASYNRGNMQPRACLIAHMHTEKVVA